MLLSIGTQTEARARTWPVGPSGRWPTWRMLMVVRRVTTRSWNAERASHVRADRCSDRVGVGSSCHARDREPAWASAAAASHARRCPWSRATWRWPFSRVHGRFRPTRAQLWTTLLSTRTQLELSPCRHRHAPCNAGRHRHASCRHRLASCRHRRAPCNVGRPVIQPTLSRLASWVYRSRCEAQGSAGSTQHIACFSSCARAQGRTARRAREQSLNGSFTAASVPRRRPCTCICIRQQAMHVYLHPPAVVRHFASRKFDQIAVVHWRWREQNHPLPASSCVQHCCWLVSRPLLASDVP